ncbi:MAG: SPOR domain-containing protein [Mariprofundus sp.]|nr:SPOR domain-containing protein [Mariprofundus sp.]
MQDKSNAGVDDEEFSLNKFDLNDDKKKPNPVDESDQFNAMIAGDERVDPPFEDDKHTPSIPNAFDVNSEPVKADVPETLNDADYAAPVANESLIADEPVIAADLEHLDDVFVEDELPPESEESGSRLFGIFVVVVIVIVGLVAWLNMGNDDEAVLSERHVSQPVLGEDVQMQRSEKKIIEMQERLAAMQERLSAKDEQIAELTHLVAEQSRKQQKMPTQKVKQVVQKVRPVVQKPVDRSVFKPIQSQPSVAKNQRGWVIVIASVATRAAADKAVKGLKAQGINAEVNPTTVKGNPWYRIQISGFASRDAASLANATLLKQHGIKDTWIHKPG